MFSSLLAFALLFSSAAFAAGPCPGTSPADELATPNLATLYSTVDVVSKYFVKMGVTDDSWFRTRLLGGDNYGYSYGVHVAAGKNRDNGTRITFSYTSDVYSAPVEYLGQNANGTYNEKQVFTNDNVYSMSYDNANQNRALYYRGVVGAQVLESNPSKNPLNASTQQLWFHQLTNNVRQLQDLPDGRGVRVGPIAGGDAGAQTSRSWGALRVRARIDGGGVMSGVSDASYVNAEAKASLRYQPGAIGVEVSLDLQDKFHSGGTEKDKGVDVSVLLGRSLAIGGSYRAYGGTLDNYAHYNLPNYFTGKNDPTFTLWVRKGLGGSASAN